ncbi:hypothetical protein GCM10023231_37490 [Olivibacter ginsenosidimutans]|uniref:Peptidoglycan hydrolase n=1 Tax=Olivibacter ginsenosidimutans TaxID=1176537 RepID=A0ABP9C4D8_9SPHI
MNRYVICLLCLLWYIPNGHCQNQAATYIAQHKDWAIDAMRTHGVPASVILAVAMHESANGTSKIATYLNNHFGIRGKNNSKHIRSSYKGYTNVEDSYTDFINYLKIHKQFASLFDQYKPYDYTGWAYGIMRGGYAQNKTWAAHILALIKKYELFTFDDRPADDQERSIVDVTKTGLVPSRKTHAVKKGETLANIAKRYKTTVRKIKIENGLSTDRLKIGQRLKI